MSVFAVLIKECAAFMCLLLRPVVFSVLTRRFTVSCVLFIL